MRAKKLNRRVGETRVKKIFLLLPKVINKEIRWFEFVYIRQRLEEVGDIHSKDVKARLDYKWVTKEYLD